MTTVTATTKRGTIITFVLYGEITPERVAREQAIAEHRAEMLS